jgi:rfaE bifunctional protein nucleotidyltransferase chain/domain
LKALEIIKHKIVAKEDLLPRLNRWKFKGEKIVFTNGCFDLLHQGHIDYLSKAADLGTKLIVAVNSDDSVKRLGKGEDRPIQDEDSRSLIMAALHFVDQVIIFNEDTPLELIKFISPDVLVKGSDYAIENIVGHEHVLEHGGEVKTIDFLDGFSTSSIVAKIKK